MSIADQNALVKCVYHDFNFIKKSCKIEDIRWEEQQYVNKHTSKMCSKLFFNSFGM